VTNTKINISTSKYIQAYRSSNPGPTNRQGPRPVAGAAAAAAGLGICTIGTQVILMPSSLCHHPYAIILMPSSLCHHPYAIILMPSWTGLGQAGPGWASASHSTLVIRRRHSTLSLDAIACHGSGLYTVIPLPPLPAYAKHDSAQIERVKASYWFLRRE
jgi:hypothetical protein